MAGVPEEVLVLANGRARIDGANGVTHAGAGTKMKGVVPNGDMNRTTTTISRKNGGGRIKNKSKTIHSR